MQNKISIRDLDLKGKKVLVRVDFNVPLEGETIGDDTRIKASIPTIQHILNEGGAIILMSHLGRPKGKKNDSFSLAPCAKRLSDLLKKPVQFAPDCIGSEVEKMAKNLKQGEILLLENLRFYPGEESPEKDPSFAESLAKLGDVYINDAFGSAHREHSSTSTIAHYFPNHAASGFLLEKEIHYLGKALLKPKRPFYALLGGAKISTKFKVIEVLMKKADALFIGGAMAYTFFKAQGYSVGNSLVENDFLSVAKELLRVSEQGTCQLYLPIDLVVVKQLSPDAEKKIIKIKDGIPDGFEGVDIGPETIEKYKKEILKASTLFWNGPFGVFEIAPFDKGTNAIAQVVAELEGTTIVGGGDSVAAIEAIGLSEAITHLSTGGGASLEFIEQGTLPGIEALSNRPTLFKSHT